MGALLDTCRTLWASWIPPYLNGTLTLLEKVFVTNFSNYENAIAEAYLKLSLTGFVSVTITAFVQVPFDPFRLFPYFLLLIYDRYQWYFAFRLYKLSGSKLVPLVSAAFSLMRFICYVGAGAYRQQHHVQTPHWVWVLFTVGILSIITDILMASKLFICLWKRRENGERVNKRWDSLFTSFYDDLCWTSSIAGPVCSDILSKRLILSSSSLSVSAHCSPDQPYAE